VKIGDAESTIAPSAAVVPRIPSRKNTMYTPMEKKPSARIGRAFPFG